MSIPAAKIHFPPEERKRILTEIEKVLESGQLTLGNHGKTFEKEFAAVAGTKYAVAVSSGTSALEIILRTLEPAGKEVIVPTNTFFATAAAVVHAGATPVFCDIDPATLMPDTAQLRAAASAQTVGVIMVHIGGAVTPAWSDIAAFCSEQKLWLVEDAAHAQGSTLDGKPAGSLGRAASFSFYPTKVMTSAEGGMITTNDDKIAEEARIYRDQGKPGFMTNQHTRMGANWRMSEVHAIIGNSQLRCLPEFLSNRRRIARVYDAELSAAKPIRYPDIVYSNYYKYCAMLESGKDRKAIKQTLREKHAVSLSGEVYELPLHLQEVFKPYATGALPAAEDACSRMICLPVSGVMTEEQASTVVKAVAEVCA